MCFKKAVINKKRSHTTMMHVVEASSMGLLQLRGTEYATVLATHLCLAERNQVIHMSHDTAVRRVTRWRSTLVGHGSKPAM